jgi:hypothetical protein
MGSSLASLTNTTLAQPPFSLCDYGWYLQKERQIQWYHQDICSWCYGTNQTSVQNMPVGFIGLNLAGLTAFLLLLYFLYFFPVKNTNTNICNDLSNG